jgi:hypothetical protein
MLLTASDCLCCCRDICLESHAVSQSINQSVSSQMAIRQTGKLSDRRPAPVETMLRRRRHAFSLHRVPLNCAMADSGPQLNHQPHFPTDVR